MAEGGVDLVQNLILDVAVAFLCIGDTQPWLMLLGVVDTAMERRVA